MADTEMRSIPVRNPRTGGTEFSFPAASAEEIALKAARLRRNQKAWAARPIAERIAIMRRWAAELIAHSKAIGAADGADTGGCHTSQFTAFIAVANINGWCEDAEGVLTRAHVGGQSVTMPTVSIQSQLVPYSLVGVISPWNAPMMLSLLDAVPALFAGSAVLLKPSEVTPRFVEPLMHTVRKVPELAEVFDVVLGDGRTGQDVVANVDLICFTGTRTGDCRPVHAHAARAATRHVGYRAGKRGAADDEDGARVPVEQALDAARVDRGRVGGDDHPSPGPVLGAFSGLGLPHQFCRGRAPDRSYCDGLHALGLHAWGIWLGLGGAPRPP